MKAAILHKQDKIENSPLKLEDIEQPPGGSDKVLVKIEASGVCHSDLHIVEGDFPLPQSMFPLIPGHEIVGTIAESHGDWNEGDRVGIGWFASACGICDQCVSGHENLCENSKVTGLNVKGGYAEYTLVDPKYITRVPDNIKSSQAAPLFCAGLTAYTAVRKLHFSPGDKIAVYGVGGLGHYALQFISKLGGKAIAITKSHAKLADSLGAAQVMEKPEGRYNGSIVFAPDSSLVSVAAEHTRNGGTVVVPAIMDKIEIPFGSFMWEKNITSVASGFRIQTREMLNFVSQNGIESRVSEKSLSEANTVLKDLKDRKIDGRVVLRP